LAPSFRDANSVINELSHFSVSFARGDHYDRDGW